MTTNLPKPSGTHIECADRAPQPREVIIIHRKEFGGLAKL